MPIESAVTEQTGRRTRRQRKFFRMTEDCVLDFVGDRKSNPAFDLTSHHFYISSLCVCVCVCVTLFRLDRRAYWRDGGAPNGRRVERPTALDIGKVLHLGTPPANS